MYMADQNDKDRFFFPHSSYRGPVHPENLVFNANLQEFAHRINYICNLETAGKLSPVDAYEKISELWQKLEESKKQLRIGDEPFSPPDSP
jgi:hypothetical protein